MSTARALQNDLQQATGVNVSDQTIRNRLHEGGLRARRPLVGPVLTARHRGARLAFVTEHQNWHVRHWHPVLFTDECRFTLSTCDRCERVWRSSGEQHDQFGGRSVMVWGGISMEGRTDLYRLDNGTLTAIRYRDEILGTIVRPYAGPVGPGFLLVHGNARPHVARVCRQFLEDEGIYTIEWPPCLPDLNPIEHLWDIMFPSIRRRQVAPQIVQELSDALVRIWKEIPQDTIRRLIRSMPRRCQVCIQARGGHTNYWVPFWVAAMKFQQNGLACCIIFSLWFFGVSLNSALCWLIILISIKWCGILSFLTHYPVHISYRYPAWYFSPLRSDVFSKYSFNFLSSVCVYMYVCVCIYIHWHSKVWDQ